MEHNAEQLRQDAQTALQQARPQRETITAPEAAEVLGLSPWSIYDLVRRRQLPHIRIGRRVLFRRESILQWLEAHEQASVAAEPETERGRIRRLK